MAEEAAVREDIINHTEESKYVRPTDPEVLKKLEWIQDQKLAFMVHWGTYSQLGMCESWPLSIGDDWARTQYTWEPDVVKFQKQYFDMNKTFNPIRFNAEEWADFAEKAGFKYFIFTTRHHDGFNMYDTKYSDYKITGEDCPFHTNPKADVAKELFNAFRAHGIAITPYYSKPDWHCPWYWAPGQEKPIGADRNPTYVPAEKPELWGKFVEFVHNQMTELVEDYGPIEALWLDGGQVGPHRGQDIRLDILSKKLREKVPGLLFVDRTVGGEYENYITPEQTIPDHIMSVPWESCVSIGNGFAYGFDDEYKTPRELVQLLIQVVTRGGNLALNLGAQPDGRLPRRGMESALGLGAWLEGCGDAIYGTRAVASGLDSGKFGFTKKGDSVYALKPMGEHENLPENLLIPWDGEVTKVYLLPEDRELAFTKTAEGVMVKIPMSAQADHRMAAVVRMD